MKNNKCVIEKIEALGSQNINESDEMMVLRLHKHNIEQLDGQELVGVIMRLKSKIRNEFLTVKEIDMNLDYNVMQFDYKNAEINEIMAELMEFI